MKILEAKFSLLLLHISEAYLKRCQTFKTDLIGKQFSQKTLSQVLGRVLYVFTDITLFGYEFNFVRKLVNGDGTTINFKDYNLPKIVIRPFSC